MNAREIDKAVILARGLGTRMQQPDERAALDPRQSAVADSGVKAMIPVGRPFLDYLLSALADAGYREVCLVIGPEHQTVRDYYTALAPHRIRVTFATELEPLGTADALVAAESFVGEAEFLALNSDNYYPVPVLRSLRTLGEPGFPAFERHSLIRKSNIAPDRVLKYAVAVLGDDEYLGRIIEKPDENTFAGLGGKIYVSMNCWRFSPVIFKACRSVPRSPRGEFELPDAVQHAIARLGQRFRAIKTEEGVLDLSSRSDIAGVADRLREIHVDL